MAHLIKSRDPDGGVGLPRVPGRTLNGNVTASPVFARRYPLHPDRGAVWTEQPACCLHDRRHRKLALQLRRGPPVPVHTGELPHLSIHVRRNLSSDVSQRWWRQPYFKNSPIIRGYLQSGFTAVLFFSLFNPEAHSWLCFRSYFPPRRANDPCKVVQ